MINTADQVTINHLIKSTSFLSRLYHGKSHMQYFKMMHDYYCRVRDARGNGYFVVAHTMFLPVEIFDAMDITPLHLEFAGYMMSMFKSNCSEVLTAAAEMGLAPEICSAHRLIGGILKMSALPPVNAVVCSNLQCDNCPKSGELVMEINHCPGFYFDYPYHENAASRDYVMRELRDMVSFLEKVSGHKLDRNKLSASIIEVNKQIQTIRKINELCKHVPSPFPPQDFLKFLAVDYMFAGKPELTQYLDSLYAEIEDMAGRGEGFVNPERFRLMGLMIPPWHLQGDVDKVLSDHGAAIVCYPNLCDWGPDVCFDPEKPLESITRKWMVAPAMRVFGPFGEKAIQPVRSAVEKFKIDGAVNFTHLGCRQMGPTYKIFKDVLDELDVPLLNIDCDLVDRTVTSEDEVCDKLEQFFELLEDR
ncbi:MAG: 2-hydroxyacyl-CoA dehydratase [Dehalococcoidales bacterium]|nr:2-hydroxyacyl-CoA dehydratase [Dehalococcoidales bacterium]